MNEIAMRPGRWTSGDRRPAHYRALQGIPFGAGPRVATRKGAVVYTARPPGSQTYCSNGHLAAVLLNPASVMVARGSGKMQPYEAQRGMIMISPAGVDNQLTWLSAREETIVAVMPEVLEELSAQDFQGASPMLQPPPFGTVDPKALQLAELMKAELDQGEAVNDLCIDSLLSIFSVHLLRTYTAAGATPARPRGGLSVSMARTLQEYLDENFRKKLSVSELAAICELSPGHFIQAFTRTFGHPPHRHLVNLRLSHAEKLLAETDLTIAEVAYRSGFSSQSHLTSSMRRYREKTPAQVRSGR